MTRHLITSVTLITFVIGSQPTLEAQQGRGSVSSARGSASHSGNTGSVQGQRASGTRTVEQTGSGGTATRQAQTQSGASRSTTREVDTANQQVDKTTTTTTAWGESGTRSRQVEGQGGYATVQGSGSTSTGRSASGEGVAGRNYAGQPAVAGIGQHQVQRHLQRRRSAHAVWRVEHRGGRPVRRARDDDAAIRLPDLDILRSPLLLLRRRVLPALHLWRRSLLLSGSATVLTAYYSYPPPGATILVIAGITYLVSQDGSYCKQTKTSDGKTGYQSVPAPQGATMAVLPATRVLVSIAGNTYYLSANAFYRRVMNGAQESFVVVTAPAGTVFVGRCRQTSRSCT